MGIEKEGSRKLEFKIFIMAIAILVSVCICIIYNKDASSRSLENSEEIAELYRDIYEKAVQENTLEDLEVTRSIVNRLGKHGYSAIDAENQNQLNMTHPELLEQFCEKVEKKEKSEAKYFSIAEDGGFIRFDFETSAGKVNVTRSVLNWRDGKPKVEYENQYAAYKWTYSEDGYLFFEEELPEAYDGAPGYTAVRIEPLDEKCREYNRRYILPVGYGFNNMFVIDWHEENFDKLNFYDLFDVFYPYVYGQNCPYEKSFSGELYNVSREEFEKVIKSYFKINSGTLRSMAGYIKEKDIYEYRTRGFWDASYSPHIPYPEVVSYKENTDGTVKLMVNVVWPHRHLAKAYCHEVIVRPLEGGDFQYVSNYIIPSEENVEASWYTEKLSDEKWEELYGNEVSKEEIYNVLQETGYPVITKEVHFGMDNYERVDQFLKKCLSGEAGECVIYEVYSNESIGKKELDYNGIDMYVTDITINLVSDDSGAITSISRNLIKSWKYTEKGWLVLEYCVPEPPKVSEVVDGSEMIRVKPLKKEYKDISERYLIVLGYQGNNLLCSDWDLDYMKEIDYNGLFEYLYFLKYGQKIDDSKYIEGIPCEEFETLIQEYLPVKTEELRQYAVYDEGRQCYAWAILGCGNYMPNAFGTSVPEVIDMKENKDGTITLTIDAVCEMLGNGAVISHQLTVRFAQNGNIQFVGNQILGDGLEQIPEYQYRVR